MAWWVLGTALFLGVLIAAYIGASEERDVKDRLEASTTTTTTTMLFGVPTPSTVEPETVYVPVPIPGPQGAKGNDGETTIVQFPDPTTTTTSTTTTTTTPPVVCILGRCG